MRLVCIALLPGQDSSTAYHLRGESFYKSTMSARKPSRTAIHRRNRDVCRHSPPSLHRWPPGHQPGSQSHPDERRWLGRGHDPRAVRIPRSSEPQRERRLFLLSHLKASKPLIAEPRCRSCSPHPLKTSPVQARRARRRRRGRARVNSAAVLPVRPRSVTTPPTVRLPLSYNWL